MGNIINYDFALKDLRLTDDGFWDFYLAGDGGSNTSPSCIPLTTGDCQVVWYDFGNPNIFIDSGNTRDIYSLVTWTGATNSGYTFNTIGLTGIDNGLVLFDKQSGDTANTALLSALTGTTLVIPSGDTRLHLTNVTGTTGILTYDYDYMVDMTKPELGPFLNLYGGFYQGYYKIDGSTYQVLPIRANYSWSAEFFLSTQVFSAATGTTLNDLYPNNAGIFFYMGTRAENKFWNKWDGADTGCTSGCTADSGCTDTVSEWCTIPKESQITLVGDYGIGIPLDPPRVDIDLVTNGFLIYGRACDCSPEDLTGETGSIIYEPPLTGETQENCCRRCGGCSPSGLGTQTACSYDGKGIAVASTREVLTNTTNGFLIYGRASKNKKCECCPGPEDGYGNETICSFSGTSAPEESIDYNLDIIDNALGFRITPEGAIGYRLLTVTGHCETTSASTGSTTASTYVSGVTIEEKYSEDGLINDDWNYIVIKFVTNYLDDCALETAKQRKGQLMFYVNGYLKFVVDDFPEFIARRLDEYKGKQVGVPFNFSIGGGSQGLIESQTFDGLDPNDRGLPIEENFGGTFVGGILDFKFNICDLSLCNIRENYKKLLGNFILLENESYLLTEDNFKLKK